jgi:hypothetical protein
MVSWKALRERLMQLRETREVLSFAVQLTWTHVTTPEATSPLTTVRLGLINTDHLRRRSQVHIRDVERHLPGTQRQNHLMSTS